MDMTFRNLIQPERWTTHATVNHRSRKTDKRTNEQCVTGTPKKVALRNEHFGVYAGLKFPRRQSHII
jgi:hypothetical protein